ncbi:hypothetical protein DM02DRAFT_265286 [Periconia macrospinosa]|uniref:Uncharacterized protein n=1 Tax=Periconia macrospinosa TaxID=97972 RepID=A0A2V1DYD6_9PLEO|nr:hypothetical protein DM02DRAFT_265286 [Periconia macrospinosa]
MYMYVRMYVCNHFHSFDIFHSKTSFMQKGMHVMYITHVHMYNSHLRTFMTSCFSSFEISWFVVEPPQMSYSSVYATPEQKEKREIKKTPISQCIISYIHPSFINPIPIHSQKKKNPLMICIPKKRENPFLPRESSQTKNAPTIPKTARIDPKTQKRKK